jgi:hypothetical protein
MKPDIAFSVPATHWTQLRRKDGKTQELLYPNGWVDIPQETFDYFVRKRAEQLVRHSLGLSALDTLGVASSVRQAMVEKTIDDINQGMHGHESSC